MSVVGPPGVRPMQRVGDLDQRRAERAAAQREIPKVELALDDRLAKRLCKNSTLNGRPSPSPRGRYQSPVSQPNRGGDAATKPRLADWLLRSTRSR